MAALAATSDRAIGRLGLGRKAAPGGDGFRGASGATRRVVVATANRGKVAELAELLVPLGHPLVAQGELGIAPAPETGIAFIDNALAKARHAASASGLPAIADDSGLVVPALDGAPGIISARYAGDRATDAENNAKLLDDLTGVDDRSAFFYCALVYLRHAEDPVPTIATADWWGEIIDTPRGISGFGYDPHFYLPNLRKTAAELPLGEKNRLSHRGKAARLLAASLAAR